MAQFEKSFPITSINEGGYSNELQDNGGETYRGISRRNFPDWTGWHIIDSAKNEMHFPVSLLESDKLQNAVQEFYKENFWDTLNLDAFSSQEIAAEVFDTGVNMGTYIAAAFLQKTLNVLNRNQLDYTDLPITGQIRSLTVAAVNKQTDTQAVLKILNCLQGARYVEICLANPKQEKFLRGWLRRVS